MNLDIFKLPDPSGKYRNKKYMMLNYIEEYNFINDLIKSDIHFKEKVYLFLNGLNEVPKCSNPNCSNITKFRNSTLGYRDYCSKKCISSDPKIIKLKEEKSLEKYGTKTPTKSDIVKNKIIKTNQKRYGGNSPMSNKQIQEKSKKTLIKNYGIDNPNKSPEITKRRVESFKDNIEQYKESYRKTSLERYGVEHPWMNKDIHKKTIYFFYKDYRQRIESKINDNITFINFEKEKIDTNLLFKCNICNDNFLIKPYQFYYRSNNKLKICTNCYPISENSSLTQIELYEFIKENYEGEIIQNSKILNPYEIDVYLPELNLGFEYNGVYWHSDKFKNSEYHLYKKNKSIKNNINLFFIWEDDWLMKKEICKSFILNKLNKSKRIGARKCEIRKVDYSESRTFLINNHLQGDVKSSIRIGLYFKNELVSLMCFSKLRLPINRNKRRDNTYELTRFCNKININVQGGASKLLKYFKENYNYESIETYSDNLISDGVLYERLGFEYKHTSKPGYWYLINSIREHRFNWRKQRLVELGYNPNKTEEEIMNELGHYRVYNAGNKKWVLNSQFI